MPFPAPYVVPGSNYVMQVLAWFSEQRSYCHVMADEGYTSPELALAAGEQSGPEIFWITDKAKWSPAPTRTQPTRTTLKPARTGTFGPDSAAAAFSHSDKCFYIVDMPQLLRRIEHREIGIYAQEKGPSGYVTFSQLAPQEQIKFQEARNAEAWGLLEVGAVRILSVEESLQFLARSPECILDSLWAERWKPTDTDTIAKSRWCVVGWQDRDIHEIERSSPMPTHVTFNVSAQLIAVRRYKLTFRDVRKAFGQSIKSNRRRQLACEQPRTGAFPGCTDPRQLVLLETEVYGLASGPAWWRVSFVKLFLQQGYVLNRLDQCALVLPGKDSKAKTGGIVLLEMDDVLEGGDVRHCAALDKISTQVDFGKVRCVFKSDEGALFNGRRWFQDRDYHMRYNMNEYLEDRLGQVDIPKPRAARASSSGLSPALPASEPEIAAIRTLEAALCARTILPEGVLWEEVTVCSSAPTTAKRSRIGWM